MDPGEPHGAWRLGHSRSGGGTARPAGCCSSAPGRFDEQKYRLGYGGGFFDRTLGSLSPRPFAIGVGYSLSSLDTIDPQPFDIPMDMIVTEQEVIR